MEVKNKPDLTEPWLSWAMELQSLAQCGLAYTENVYDKERFERIREIAAEMVSFQSEMPREKVTSLFCSETGYQTPKIDTRAAIFKGDKILLVQENDGLWSLPGGWCDVLESVKSNTEKEAWEEAGLLATAVRLIAVQDRRKHNLPEYLYNICKVFVLCECVGGKFQKNSETVGSGYFALDELPPLSEAKNTKEQIALCFDAYHDPQWQPPFD